MRKGFGERERVKGRKKLTKGKDVEWRGEERRGEETRDDENEDDDEGRENVQIKNKSQ